MKNKHKLITATVAALMAISAVTATNDQQVVAAATVTKNKKSRNLTKRHHSFQHVKGKAGKSFRGGKGNVLKPKAGTRVQDNLYLAVNSDWMKTAKIPADSMSTSSFDEIDLKIQNQLERDMADFADGKKPMPNVPNFDKAVELYKLARDFDKRNSDGAQPIKADLAKLEGIKDFADFNAKAADLYNGGIVNLPISFDVEPDMKNARKNALYFGPAATFLPDASSYKDASSKQLLAILQKQSIALLKKAGIADGQAKSYVENALKFDGQLAKNVKSTEQNADTASQYNPTSLQNFKGKFKDFDIDQFLQKTVGTQPDQIVVTDPNFLANANKLLNKNNFAELKGWLIVNFINSVADELSQDFRETGFAFSQAETGQAKLPSSEKQAFNIANSEFSDVIGIYYGQTYFGADAKKDVTTMINQILAAYEKRLQNNDWLSKATREKAIDKLKAMVVKVGYPDQAPAYYNNVQITPASKGGTLYSNEKAITTASIKENFAQLSRPVDRNKWNCAGDEVNAAYSPQDNSVTIPAAILQAPFYDQKQSKAANLGGIGTVIGHEISHAFDNNGAQFDKYGDLHNWWTKKDYAQFKKRVKAEVKLFDGIKYGPAKVNGKQTVSENIADQGGLTVAIEVAKSEGDDLHELFENNARIWKLKTTPKAIQMLLAVDVHAPDPLRCNVQAQCQPEFYKTFKVKSTDGMWLAPKKRVNIW